jgi:hypothetical protein
MRHFLLILLILLGPSSLTQADQSQESPLVIVELFSSEGCSSCRNNLGWRDVHSRPEYTQRQKEYAQVFKDQGVYTPEMVVNGSDAFTGSDQGQLQKDLDRELSIPGSVTLHISLTKQESTIIVHYSAQGFTGGDVVNIALVERGLSTDVTAGENAGRTLHHDNVVKEFQTKSLTKAPSFVTIRLDRIHDVSQASLIAYVQNPQTMLIEAAKQLDLEND